MFRSTLVLLLATLVAGLVALPGEAMAAPGSPGSPDYRIGVDDILQVMVRPVGGTGLPSASLSSAVRAN